MTRNGKIGRLPSTVREELNLRLSNGEEGDSLLAWINALPLVQASLQEHHHAAPITKQNLSEWRQGGFREAQIREEWTHHAHELFESALHLDQIVDTPLIACDLAAVLAARYAALLNGWDGEPDPKFEEKARLLRGLNQDLALLQKTMQRAAQQKKEFDQNLEEQDRRTDEETKKALVAPLWAKLESDELAGIFGGGERGQKMAELVTAVKHDLPRPKSRKEAQEPPTASPSQQPQAPSASPAQSNPVAPRPTKSEPAGPRPANSDQNDPNPTDSKPVALSPTQSHPVQPNFTSSRRTDDSESLGLSSESSTNGHFHRRMNGGSEIPAEENEPVALPNTR